MLYGADYEVLIRGRRNALWVYVILVQNLTFAVLGRAPRRVLASLEMCKFLILFLLKYNLEEKGLLDIIHEVYSM